MNDKETRIDNTSLIRQVGTSRKITGTAIVFNSITNIGWFQEKIDPSAVDEALLNQDVRALFNHDSNLILARTKSGTLRLFKTARGLEYEIDTAETSYGDDLLVSLRRGDVTGSSFGFAVARGGDRWETLADGTQLRIITKISKLFDVSPVTFPAYPDTEAAARSFEQYKRKSGTWGSENDLKREQQLLEIKLQLARESLKPPSPRRWTIAEAEALLKTLKH